MLFAMDSLNKLAEILELKFIQRVASCQIHRYGSELIIGEELKKMRRLTVTIALSRVVFVESTGAKLCAKMERKPNVLARADTVIK